jgi:hypothetical protein
MNCAVSCFAASGVSKKKNSLRKRTRLLKDVEDQNNNEVDTESNNEGIDCSDNDLAIIHELNNAYMEKCLVLMASCNGQRIVQKHGFDFLL